MSSAQHQADSGKLVFTNIQNATLLEKNRIVGFWLFLGGECALFASLIGTYLGLVGQTAGGPGPGDVFDLFLTGVATVVLLSSSATALFAVLAMQEQKVKQMHFWWAVTLLCGLTFLFLEIYEFIHYVHLGLRYQTSGFSSAFYTLVGFHGAHVIFGLCWIFITQMRMVREGITRDLASKMYIAGLYWHFIDVVWVLIFTVVYLFGIAG